MKKSRLISLLCIIMALLTLVSCVGNGGAGGDTTGTEADSFDNELTSGTDITVNGSDTSDTEGEGGTSATDTVTDNDTGTSGETAKDTEETETKKDTETSKETTKDTEKVTETNKETTKETEKATETTKENTTETDKDDEPILSREDFYKQNKLVIYPEFPKQIERNYMYSVSVTQGSTTKRIPVYNHCEDSRVSRNPSEKEGADEYRRFSTFAFSGKQVRVDIKVNCDFKSYSVMPTAKNFKHSYKDGVISVYLDKPDYFFIRLDYSDSTILAVTADYPEYPGDLKFGDAKTITVDGWYEPNKKKGYIILDEPGTVLYLKPGSVLNARVVVKADNCKIIGRGAIVDPFEDIYSYNVSFTDYDDTEGIVLFVNASDNTYIDGIHMLDAKGYNIFCKGIWNGDTTKGTRVYNTKIFSTQMCSDGITFCYFNEDSHAEHCFVYCGDNCLPFEDNASYKDMTLGTTCNALYPQTDITNCTLEDIHVFRADEGIINQDMNGTAGGTKIQNVRITNIDTVDTIYVPRFFFVESNVAVSSSSFPENGLVITNISMGNLGPGNTSHIALLQAQGNYRIVFKNLAIHGNVAKASDFTGGSYKSYIWGSSFNYQTGGAFTPVVHKETYITNTPEKVYIGSSQVFFKENTYKDGDNVLLPYSQIKEELRTEAEGETVKKNGIKYISSDKLVSSGMAKAIRKENGNLYITPSYNGEDLLLPDKGEISKFTEHVCYAQHTIVTKDGSDCVYNVTTTRGSQDVGIFRVLNEELRKYGTGTYRLTFEAKVNSSANIVAVLGTKATARKAQRSFACGSTFAACTFDFTVDSAVLGDSMAHMLITVDKVNTGFAVKNIKLVKIS